MVRASSPCSSVSAAPCSLNDILVYTVAPLVGGGLAALLFALFIEKQHGAPAKK